MSANPPNSKRTDLQGFLVGAVVLLLVSALGSFQIQRWEKAGDNLIEGGSFNRVSPLQSAGWQHEGDVSWQPTGGIDGSGGVLVEAGPTQGVLAFTLLNPADHPGFLVAAQLRSDQLVRGNTSWANGALSLFFFDEFDGIRWDWPRDILELEGTSTWVRGQRFFYIPTDAPKVQVRITNLGASGRLYLDDLEFLPARESSIWRSFHWLLSLLWFLLAMGCAHRLGLWRSMNGRLAILAVVIIVIATTAETTTLRQWSVMGADAVDLLINRSPSDSNAGQPVPKPRHIHLAGHIRHHTGFSVEPGSLVHVGLFWLLAVGAYRLPKRPTSRTRPDQHEDPSNDKPSETPQLFGRLKVTVGLILIAAISESFQWDVFGRTPKSEDLGLNCLGICLGLACVWTAEQTASIWRKRKRDHSNNHSDAQT